MLNIILGRGAPNFMYRKGECSCGRNHDEDEDEEDSDEYH